MKLIYQQIKNHLKTKLDSDNVWIDLFSNQFANETQNYPIMPPVVYIQLGTINYEPKKTTKFRTGILRGVLHVGQDFYSDTHSGADNEIGEADFFDLIDKVKTAIEGFNTDNIASIVLDSVEYDENITSLLVHKINFRTTISEELPPKTTISKPPLEIIK